MNNPTLIKLALLIGTMFLAPSLQAQTCDENTGISVEDGYGGIWKTNKGGWADKPCHKGMYVHYILAGSKSMTGSELIKETSHFTKEISKIDDPFMKEAIEKDTEPRVSCLVEDMYLYEDKLGNAVVSIALNCYGADLPVLESLIYLDFFSTLKLKGKIEPQYMPWPGGAVVHN